MRKNSSYQDSYYVEHGSGTAFDRFLRQQRRAGRRWASGGKYDAPRHRENWDDDYEDYEDDDYSEYDGYDEDEFDSYSN